MSIVDRKLFEKYVTVQPAPFAKPRQRRFSAVVQLMAELLQKIRQKIRPALTLTRSGISMELLK